jgi:hypothetical protein
MKISVADAKNKLPELIKAVEDGQTLPWISSEQKSLVAKKRKLETRKGKIQIRDVDWWKPMSDD